MTRGRTTRADTAFRGHALGGFSALNTVTSDAGQVVDFQPGRTLLLVFQSLGTVAAATETVVSCSSGNLATGKGFWVTRAGADAGGNASKLFILSPANHFQALVAPAAHGITVIAIVWRASDSHVLYSVNGGPLTDAGACVCTAADATCVTRIGSPDAGLGSLALTSGRVIACAIVASELSQAAARAATCTTGNRFFLPPDIETAATFSFNASRDWNGSASSITSRGSSPITLSVAGSPTRTRLAEQRIAWPVSDSHTEIMRASTPLRASFARKLFTTSARAVGCEVVSTMYDAFAAQSNGAVYVDGSWYASIAAVQVTESHVVEVQLAAGAKSCAVFDGAQALRGATSTRDGTAIRAVRVPLLLADGTSAATTIRSPTVPADRLVLFGDSIITGFGSSNLPRYGTSALVRAAYPGAVSCLGCGTESIWNCARSAELRAATAARIAAELDGTESSTLVVALGTNDYAFVNAENEEWPAADFGAAYGALLDAVKALVPDLEAYLVTPIQRIAPATEAENGAGDTLDDYRGEIVDVQAARPGWCTLIDGAAGAIVSNGNLDTDGLHPLDAGHAEIAAALDAAGVW